MNVTRQTLLLVLLPVLATATWRVLNTSMHLYHLVPVAAMGLFSGAALRDRKWSMLVPLAAMLLSDLGLSLFTDMPGFYGISQVINYLALAMVALLGHRVDARKPLQIGGYTIAGSLLFFLVSNFGTYLSGYYGFGFSSLMECYAMALPFYRSELSTQFFVSSLVADMLFSLLAFGLLAVATLKQMRAGRA